MNYKNKGLIKVWNGNKFKFVSYKNDDGHILFSTNSNSKKIKEIKEKGYIIVKDGNGCIEYHVNIIEDEKEVDKLFKQLKNEKVVKFFIPRKNKVIVEFYINL